MNYHEKLSITINGEMQELEVPANRVLIDLIKDDLGLIGTKDGCRQGVCGACTVIIDNIPVRSCLTLAVRCHGKHVTTIEGLREAGGLHPLQEAFIEAGAVQCGYCTPGALMMAAAFLKENPTPTEGQVREALVGNICRCTGYTGMVEAVMTVGANGGMNQTKSLDGAR